MFLLCNHHSYDLFIRPTPRGKGLSIEHTAKHHLTPQANSNSIHCETRDGDRAGHELLRLDGDAGPDRRAPRCAQRPIASRVLCVAIDVLRFCPAVCHAPNEVNLGILVYCLDLQLSHRLSREATYAYGTLHKMVQLCTDFF